MRKKKLLNENSDVDKTDEEIDELVKARNKKVQVRNPYNGFYSDFFKSMFKTFGYTLLAFMALLFLMFLVIWLRG
jgi:hypothetical protein